MLLRSFADLPAGAGDEKLDKFGLRSFINEGMKGPGAAERSQNLAGRRRSRERKAGSLREC